MSRFLVALIGAGLFCACGGTEKAASTENPSPDASASDDSGAGGSSMGATEGGNAAGASGAGGGGIDLDAFPIPDGPIGVCAMCIRDMCQSDLATCANDPKCLMGVTCSLEKCAQYAMGDAGAEGLACLTKCFDGNIANALSALSGLTCVTTKCDACTSLLDGGRD